MSNFLKPRSDVDARRLGGTYIHPDGSFKDYPPERSQSDGDKIKSKPSTSIAGKVLESSTWLSALSDGNSLSVPRVLLLDIETSPNLAYVWSMYKVDNISSIQLVEHSEMLCFAAKWFGLGDTYCYSTHIDGKRSMVKALRELLNLADIVITYNGNKFDIPVANTEMLMEGLDPPSPYKSLDLYLTIRSTFRFPISKLEYVLKHTGLKQKANSGGFETWIGCMKGDPEAWKEMMQYNITDVDALEELYRFVRGWIPRHPSVASYTQSHVCPNCGSSQLVKEGFAYTQISKFQQWSCKNCGKWSRSTHRESGTDISEVAT